MEDKNVEMKKVSLTWCESMRGLKMEEKTAPRRGALKIPKKFRR